MLIWKTMEPDVEAIKKSWGPTKQGFSWDAWYAKNRARLSEKRARRYREDASYREAALERSRHQRESKKSTVTGPFTIPFGEAAEMLGITLWVLREWRRKNYYPEPLRREGRLWFSEPQVQLLRHLGQFFAHHARVGEANRDELYNLVSLTYANWT